MIDYYLPSPARVKMLVEKYRAPGRTGTKATPGPYVVSATPGGRYEEHYAPPGARPRRIGSWAPEHEDRARQEAEELNQRTAGPLPDDELPGEGEKDLRVSGPWAHEPYGKTGTYAVRRQGEETYHSYHRTEAAARKTAAILNRLHRLAHQAGAHPYGNATERALAHDWLLDQGSDEATARAVSGHQVTGHAHSPAGVGGKAIGRVGSRVRTRAGFTGTITGRDPAWSKNRKPGYTVRLDNAPGGMQPEVPVNPQFLEPIKKKSLDHGACCRGCADGGACETSLPSDRPSLEARWKALRDQENDLYRQWNELRSVAFEIQTKSLGSASVAPMIAVLERDKQINRLLDENAIAQRRVWDLACDPQTGCALDSDICKSPRP
jgi:hypothetical protein